MTRAGLPVSLREITRANLRAVCALEVDATQRNNVASNALSLAEAWLHPVEAWPRAVYAGEEPVGFVMVYDPSDVDEPRERDFFLWRLMIDRHSQGRGYGRAAVEAVLNHVCSRGAQRILVSHVKQTPALGRFYASFGFAYIEREDERERYMVRVF